MFKSNAQLQADLARWRSQGWVSEAGAHEIGRELASRGSGVGLYGALAVLGAILLGFAAMSFVAANWDHMSKLARLVLLGSSIAASYGTAHELFRRHLDPFAHAAALTGIAMFGASIMLIAQMYHMDGNPPDAVWLWATGALAAGLLLQSNPALAASIVLICVWSFMETEQQRAGIHWSFLPMWAIAASGVAMKRWRRGMHLLALAISAWLVVSLLRHDWSAGRYLLVVTGVALAALAALAGPIIDRWRRISNTMLMHGMTLAYIGLFAIQFVPLQWFGNNQKPNLWLWGGGTLALLIAAMAAGWRTGNQRVLWLSYAFFSIEIFTLYITKIGSLLGTSAFFFIAGLLVIALATVAYRMRETNTTATGATS